MTDADRAFDAMAAALSEKVCEHLTAAFAADYQAKLDSVTQAHAEEVAEYQFRLGLIESRANAHAEDVAEYRSRLGLLESKLAKLGLVESKLKASETRVQRLRDALYAKKQVIWALEHIDRAKDALLEIERSRNAGSRPTMIKFSHIKHLPHTFLYSGCCTLGNTSLHSFVNVE